MMHFSEKAIQAGKDLGSVIVPHTHFEAVADAISVAVQIGWGTGIFAGVRVSAPSGAGKSALLDYISLRMQSQYGSTDHLPVIKASLKEDPAVSQLQNDLLKSFNYAIRASSARETNGDVNDILVSAIKKHHIRLIALDEFHHVFLGGGQKVATLVIDWLKRLMNLTNVPVLLLGTERLESLQGVDSQLTTRVPTVATLSHFKLNAEWKGFLTALLRECRDVDMSPAHSEFAQALFRVSEGVPRTVKGLLVRALCCAITKGEQRLSRETLAMALQMQFGVVSNRDNPFAEN